MNAKEIPAQHEFDVIVVGASAAGCATAILYANKGLNVALIEQRRDVQFFKKICTHYIQSSCRDTLRNIGIKNAMEYAGAIPTTIKIWTRWGWIYGADPTTDYGYNIRREKFDPLIRKEAMNTAGVSFFPDTKFTNTVSEAGLVVGIEVENNERERRTYRARLVVGADGRNSKVVEAAGIATETMENNRFSCFAIFDSTPEEKTLLSRMWLLDPWVAYQFPNDNRTTLIAIMPTMDELPKFKRDRSRSFFSFVKQLDSAPCLDGRKPLGSIMLNVDNANLKRGETPPGLALVGDALVCSDPLFGLGISWALLSAQWLVDETADAINESDERLSKALKRYRVKHRLATEGHLKVITDMSTAKPLGWAQRTLFSAAARSPRRAKIMNDFLAADISAEKFTSLGSLMASTAVNLRHTMGGIFRTEPMAIGQNQMDV